MFCDMYYPNNTGQQVIIRDSKTLSSYFAQINKSRKPGLPVPKIDFNDEVVILVSSGLVNSSGIPKVSIKNETDTTIGLMLEFSPDNQKLKGSFTPFCLYKLKSTNKEIAFH